WRTGTTLTNSLSFAAGNDKGSMRASVTYSDNEWIMPNTGFERVAISTKGDYEIAKGIKLNSTMNYYNRSSGNLPSTGYNNHTISYFMILTNANNNIDWYRKMHYFGYNVSLTNDELSKINSALATIKIVSERYPAQIQQTAERS